MNNVVEKEFYCVKDIVDMGLASQAQVYNIFGSKGFPAIKIGSTLRVKKDDFWKWIDQQKGK